MLYQLSYMGRSCLECLRGNEPVLLRAENQKSQSRVKLQFERPWDRLVPRKKRPQANSRVWAVKGFLECVDMSAL